MTPEYIVDTWTREKLDLMVEKLNERKMRKVQAGGDSSGSRGRGDRMVSDSQLFQAAGGLIKVVKK